MAPFFGDRFRRCNVDESRIRSKTAPFSFENGLMWTGLTSTERANDRYSARTFSCHRANFAVCPLYDRSTMLERLLQTVWVCFFGEETKTKYCLGIRKNIRDNGRSRTFEGL